MFDIKTLKSDAALIASAPRTSLCQPLALAAIERLVDLPGPNRSPFLARRLRHIEFEEFRSIGRAILGAKADDDSDLLRFQLYAEIVYEALDDQMRSYGACLAAE